jgi:hypothetical protein
MTNQTPSRTPARSSAFDVIDGEREYQNKTHPNSQQPSPFEIASLIDQYSVKLAAMFDPQTGQPHEGTQSPIETFQKRIRQIGALAVKAMEIHGSAPRENHVPASAGITGEINIVTKGDSL